VNVPDVPLCPFHAVTGLWCPLCGSLRGVALLGDGQVLAALGSNLLLLVTLPVLAWGAVALAGGGAVAGPWVVPRRAWIALAAFAVLYTIIRNLPWGAALAP
jgi:hypothetical protein